MIKRIICFFKGHDWLIDEQKFSIKNAMAVIKCCLFCERCKKAACKIEINYPLEIHIVDSIIGTK